MTAKIDIEKIKKIQRNVFESMVHQREGALAHIHQIINLQSHILLIHILYELKESINVSEVAFINDEISINSEILFHNIPSQKIDMEKGSYKINKSKKYPLVFGMFPFGKRILEKKTCNGDISTHLITESLDTIDEEGFGIFITLDYPTTFDRDKIRERLSKKDFFVNAIIGLPDDFMRPTTSILTQAIIVSKNKTDKEFIADIDSLKSFNFSLKNMFRDHGSMDESLFLDNNTDDIDEGAWIKPGEFKGFVSHKLTEELKKARGDLNKTGESHSLGDLCTEMNLLKSINKDGGENFIDHDNSVYVPLIGVQDACVSNSELAIKPHNYIQLVLNPEKVINTYLKIFFNTKWGKLLLQAHKEIRPGFIKKLSRSSFDTMFITIPSLKMQKEVINVARKCERINSETTKLIDCAMRNPISDKKSIEQLDNVIKSIGALTIVDRIRDMITSGEDKNTEFKQTIVYDTRKKDRDQIITDMWIKTVAAFLNTNGGDLLIGVSDDKNITGMNFEMKKYFKKGEDYQDNLMKHVKNILKDYIGEPFYPYINSQLVEIDDDYVLWINCKPSDKEVFVKGKDFYVRTHPATDKLEGQKAIDYIKRRFLDPQESL